MSIVIDSGTEYKHSFSKQIAQDSVYFTGTDAVFGRFLTIVYKSGPTAETLSAIVVGAHGVHESVDMTISAASRYFGACRNLPRTQATSLVRQALAIACLRSYVHIKPGIKKVLEQNQLQQAGLWDETAAGELAAAMVPAIGKFPVEIGTAIIDSGILSPKLVKAVVVDIVYQDIEAVNETNNELVYLFGSQLEHLFDPLAEYCPEPVELLYSPPTTLPSPNKTQITPQQPICNELFTLQTHFTANLVQFLQNYLIPLRVKALSNTHSDLDIRHLNTIFPPTIDEVVRVNTILHEALQAALPFGPFEVVKACGVSVPYFYKACMRHEAATRGFTQTIHENYDLLQTHAPLEVRN